MNLRTVACAVTLLSAAKEMSPLRVATPLAPLVDQHQHLLSPMLAGRVFESARGQEPVTADRLIAQLDAAGIQRAAVLSLGYMHGSPSVRRDDEYAQVRAENDWTSQQVAQEADGAHGIASLKHKFPRNLDQNAAGAAATILAECRTRDVAVNGARPTKLLVVEDIESLEPNLERLCSGDPKILQKSHIDILDAGSVEESSWGAADFTERWQAEAGAVVHRDGKAGCKTTRAGQGPTCCPLITSSEDAIEGETIPITEEKTKL